MLNSCCIFNFSGLNELPEENCRPNRRRKGTLSRVGIESKREGGDATSSSMYFRGKIPYFYFDNIVG
jgi:hypothetical protein